MRASSFFLEDYCIFDNLFTDKKYSNILFLAIIAVLTVSIYYNSLNNQFLNDWDDGVYVTNNPEIKTLHGDSIGYTLKNSFKTFSNGHYHPLTMLSYSAEYNLFGLNPKPYHAVNLILHILNAFLVFAFIWMLTKQNFVAFITALLFAIHPMHVESVSWISDRKDLLCSLFFIGAMCAYLMYLKKGGNKFYLITLLMFLLALFSKAMAVTLPIVLFAIDYFMDRKISKKTIIEKIPFLVLSLIFGYLSIQSQKASDALGDMDAISVTDKLLFSSYSIIMYIFKLVSFFDLSAFYNYPLSENGKYPMIFYTAPFLLAAFIYLIYKMNCNKKVIYFGIAFFLITVALVLQIIPAGNVIMADRYSYLPYIGLFFIIASAINYFITDETKAKWIKPVVLTGSIIFFGLCSYYSFSRTKVWHDSLALWTDTIKKNPDAALPYSNRAALFLRNRQFENAVSDLNHAILIRPKYVSAHYNRGLALKEMGKFNEAVADFSFVLQNKSRDVVSVYMMRGEANMYAGNALDALNDFTEALKYNPNIAQAYYQRGLILHSVTQYKDAINDYNRALEIDPKFADVYYVRALSFYKIKDFNRSLQDVMIAQKLGINVEKNIIDDLISKTQ